MLPRLRPGDTLQLDAGDYRDGLPLHDLHGTPAAPITIEGSAGPRRAVFHARDGVHTVSLMDCSHIALRRLELDGGHLAVDGVKAEGQGARRCRAVHDIVLDGLYIHDHDGDQQSVGINSKCTAWNWTVSRTVIERVGTGMYFGGSGGDTPFVRGLIEDSVVRDVLGYCLQIKHQEAWPRLADMPHGHGRTTIRRNVFSKALGGATGRAARPNVLVGHWPLAGRGSDDVYEIYGNVFWQNSTGEPLFQGEGHVALYSNVFVNHRGDGLLIRPHRDRPRRVSVFWNTVVARGRGLEVRGASGRYPVRVVGNAIFSGTRPTKLVGGALNVTARFEQAAASLRSPASDSAEIDVSPKGSVLQGPELDVSAFAVFSEWDEDIEGRRRTATSRGAYCGASGRRWRAAARAWASVEGEGEAAPD